MAVTLSKGVTLVKASDNATEAKAFSTLYRENITEYRRVSNTSANYHALATKHHNYRKSMAELKALLAPIGTF